MAMVKVLFKQRAYIGGRTYDAGEQGDIDENDVHESVCDLVDRRVEERRAPDPDETPTKGKK